MNVYKTSNFTSNSFETVPGMGRSLLQVYTGDRISEPEANALLSRIADHKWYVSERLNRDVGFHVAAIDYVENFYEPEQANAGFFSAFVSKSVDSIRNAARAYLTAKGNTLPL